MQTCPVTGRQHRTAPELKAELIRLDTAIAAMTAIERAYAALVVGAAGQPLPTEVGDARNAAHDAVAALKRERDEVAENPRPIPTHEAGTYELMQQNID